ncbi:hypothetical protein NE237_026805 [Protea cynaroides]|uniref:Beta-fructofuranosidase n=1 Tax=Protea cynaroides TaxID=273540 RepID=A0A9Q0GNY5_9MAGN|nr:hypothetical protein NE237_026805 [Protea cynaroides]
MTSSGETMTFTAAWFIGLCFLLLGCGIHVEASHRVFRHLQVHHNITATHQPYRTGYHRTGYHFQPAKHWINGPMIYKGIYHLFYQYNPHGAVWGNIVWAHATSIDLTNWVHYEPAIKPSIESDIEGCWSGSTTILPDGKPAILYTGIPPLLGWLQMGNAWRVIIGSKIDRVGKAILYKSKDFFKWERLDHPLHSSENTGMWECPDFVPVSVNEGVGLDTSVNGPNVKHVFKVSLDDKKDEYYTIGTYNLEKDIYVADEGSIDDDSGLRYDYGKFYASKTFFDSSKNRRILWGWINESDSVIDDVKKGWSGVQAIPRNIWLDKAGKQLKQLVQWPVAEIENLRKTPVELQNTQLNGGSVLEVTGVTASQVDVEVSFNLPTLEKAETLNLSGVNPQILCSQKGVSVKGNVGPFGLLALASKGLEEQTAIFFRVFKDKERLVVLMCSDQSRSSDGSDQWIKQLMELFWMWIRSAFLIDHSIVESFSGKGKVCITSRVYPEQTIFNKAYLYVFNNGTENISISKLSAWSMEKAKIDK